MKNIPIYRAKKIDSDGYVIGELHTLGADEPFITTQINDRFIDHIIIDPSTLSIHFPDMLDSQGNKIFASLNKDGKGGDIVKYTQMYFNGVKDDIKTKTIKYDKYSRSFNINNTRAGSKNYKIIGIQ